MPYDLFISYARRDDTSRRVSALVERIADDYRQFSGEELSCFFDKSEIKGGHDWRRSITSAGCCLRCPKSGNSTVRIPLNCLTFFSPIH